MVNVDVSFAYTNTQLETKTERPASFTPAGRSGGLFGFDHEVVTPSIPQRDSPSTTSLTPGTRRDLTPDDKAKLTGRVAKHSEQPP